MCGNRTMQPLISIVIPVYNAERYINKCIDSVLSQSYANWELLLIDDGSSDDSGRICDGYSKKDDRIRTFHKRNGGVGSARNVGIEQASGDFITFIDSDDWISSQYIADFVRCNPQRKSIVVSGLITKTPSEEYVSFQYADESTLNEVTARDLIVRYNLFRDGGPTNKLFDLQEIKKNVYVSIQIYHIMKITYLCTHIISLLRILFFLILWILLYVLWKRFKQFPFKNREVTSTETVRCF